MTAKMGRPRAKLTKKQQAAVDARTPSISRELAVVLVKNGLPCDYSGVRRYKSGERAK